MRFLFIISLALSLAACAAPKNAAGTVDTAKEAQAAFETYVEAINAGQIEKAGKMYDTASGFHWVERGAVQYDAGTDAAASLRSLSNSGGNAQMTMSDIQVAEMGVGSALVSGHFDYEMLGGDGEVQFAFDGWMTVGMVKRTQGWKIAGGQTGPGKSAVLQSE